jgi:hypothetical protein
VGKWREEEERMRRRVRARGEKSINQEQWGAINQMKSSLHFQH